MKKLFLILLTVGSLFAIDYRVLEKDKIELPGADRHISYVCIDNLVYLTVSRYDRGYMASVHYGKFPLACKNFQKFIARQR
jgi:hypothetical protein